MIRAKCPFCGEENVVGPAPVERPGEPPATMWICEHFVFQGFTKHLGSEYVLKEFGVESGKTPGSYSLDADVMRILNGHFKFDGPVAFAPSYEARAGARAAVEDFLRARGLLA